MWTPSRSRPFGPHSARDTDRVVADSEPLHAQLCVCVGPLQRLSDAPVQIRRDHLDRTLGQPQGQRSWIRVRWGIMPHDDNVTPVRTAMQAEGEFCTRVGDVARAPSEPSRVGLAGRGAPGPTDSPESVDQKPVGSAGVGRRPETPDAALRYSSRPNPGTGTVRDGLVALRYVVQQHRKILCRTCNAME